MTVNLSIKSVPEALAERLRARAERHHRSLQGELMAIIEQAAASEGAEAPRAADASSRQSPTEAKPRGGLSIERIGAALRTRFAEPLTGSQRAVDIVRELRDSR